MNFAASASRPTGTSEPAHHRLRSRRRTDFMRADQRRDRALGHQPPRRTPACAAGGGARSSRLLWLLIARIASAKFTRVSDTDVDVLAQAELVSGHALWGVSPRFFYRVHRDVYPDLLGPSCPFHAAFLLGGSKELPPEVVEVYQRIKKPGARKHRRRPSRQRLRALHSGLRNAPAAASGRQSRARSTAA